MARWAAVREGAPVGTIERVVFQAAADLPACLVTNL